jgi:hypothetical protein
MARGFFEYICTYTCTENPNSLGDGQLVGWKAFAKDPRISASNCRSCSFFIVHTHLGRTVELARN